SIGRQTYTVAQHTRFREGITLLIHARRDEAGEWFPVEYRPLYLGACLESESADDAATLNEADSDWFVEEDSALEGVCIRRIY
ncbi:MAG: hypothetical protein AAF692_00460, partial [Pseudomonadota bacterium]